jgi:hypothetical protein
MGSGSAGTTIGIIIVALIVLGAVWWFVTQRRRSEALREQFGPEYERTVKGLGDQSKAEAELARRAERVKALDIHPLEEGQRKRFADAWRSDQAKFVDDPKGAVIEADRLVADLMQVRGYPVGDFEQRAADVSVDHPHVVENYRIAHDIAERERNGKADTEDLRKAMVHYRALFEDLLDSGPVDTAGGART